MDKQKNEERDQQKKGNKHQKMKTTNAQQKDILNIAYEKQKVKVSIMVRDAMEEHERCMTKAIMEFFFS